MNVPASRERRLNSIVADATREKSRLPWVETHGQIQDAADAAGTDDQTLKAIEASCTKKIEMLIRLKTKLRALLRKSEMERELDEELGFHIERQTEQNVRLGMNPEEA